jgi:uncharacterized protein (TIRG00374 family)
MKRVSKRRLGIIFLSLVGGALFWIVLTSLGSEEILKIARELQWWEAALIFSFPIFSFAIAAARWQVVLRAVGEEVAFRSLLKKIFVGAAVSLIAPSFDISGQTTKAISLRRDNVASSTVFASLFLDNLARVFANISFTFFALAAVLVLGFSSLRDLIILWSVAGLLLLLVFLWKMVRRGNRFGQFLFRLFPVSDATVEEVDRFWELLRFSLNERRLAFWSAFLLSLLGVFWEMIQISLTLFFLGSSPYLLLVILLYLGMGIPRSVPVPSGIGFTEAGAALASAYLGESGALGLTAMLALRLRDLSTLLLGFFLFLRHRFRV